MAFAMKNMEDTCMMENLKWAPGRSVSPCISETEVHETVGKKLSKTTNKQNGEEKDKVIDEQQERTEQKQWNAFKNFENNFNNEANEFFTTDMHEDLSSASDDFKKALEGVNVFGGSSFFSEYNELFNHVVMYREFGESEEDKLTNNCCTQNEVSTSTEVSVSGGLTGVRSVLHRDTFSVSVAEFKLLDKLEQKGHYPLPLQGSNDSANSSAIPLSELLKCAKFYGLENKMLLFSVEDHKESWSLKQQNTGPFEITESVFAERFADYLHQNDFSHQSHVNAFVNDQCLANIQEEQKIQINSADVNAQCLGYFDQCLANIQEGEIQNDSVNLPDQCLANIQEGEIQNNSVNIPDQCLANIQEGDIQNNSVNFLDQCLTNIQEGEIQNNSVNFSDQCLANIQEGEIQNSSVNFPDQCLANIQVGEIQNNSVNFSDQCLANIQEGELQVNSVNFPDQCLANIQEREIQNNSVNFPDQCLANFQEGEIQNNSDNFPDQCLANIQEGEIQNNSVNFPDQCLANFQEGEIRNNSDNFPDQCLANIQEGEKQNNSDNFLDQCLVNFQEGEMQNNSDNFPAIDQCLANIQEGEKQNNSDNFLDQCLVNFQEGEIQINSVDVSDKCPALTTQEEGELQNISHQRDVQDGNSLIFPSLAQFVTVPETSQSSQQYCYPFQETNSVTSLFQNLYSNLNSVSQIHPVALKKSTKIVPLPSQPDGFNLPPMIRQNTQNHDVPPSESVKQRLKRKLTNKNESPEVKTRLPDFELIGLPSNENERGTASKKRRKVKK